MKKNLIKFLSLVMALTLVFALASCGGNDEPETTTQAPETTEAPVDATAADDTTVAADDTTVAADDTTVAADDTTAAAEESTAAEGESTTEGAPAGDMTKAEFVAFLNAETAKIAKSGKYGVNRKCTYTNPIDVGGATNILNDIITAIDENSNLDTVVGDFIGIGTTKGNVPADDIKGDYKIQATSLKEADLGSFKAANGVYSFTLADATNPKKTGATPLSRFTRDFITHEEVVDGIAEFTTAIKVKDTTVKYDKIKVEVTVEDGKITNIDYSYAFDAKLTLSVLVTINGSGAAVANATYSNIKY